jgi:hypothetical protein
MPVKLAFQERSYALLMKLHFFNGIRSGIGNVLKRTQLTRLRIDVYSPSFLIPEHALRVLYE